MKLISLFIIALFVTNTYAQNIIRARSFFEQGTLKVSNNASIRDTVITLIDDNSGEVVSYSKIKTKNDGRPITSNDVLPEGGIYRKKGNDFYRMNFVEVNVKKLGAKGDDVTDNSKIFQQAIEYLSVTGGRLLIPAGSYRISGITISGLKRINIQGDGENASYLKKIGTTNTPVLSFSSASNELEFHCEINDLTIDGNNAVNGFNLINFARFTFKNIRIRNCITAINGNGVLVGAFYNCTFILNQTGMRLRKSSSNIYNNLLTLYSCVIAHNTLYAIDYNEGSMLTITGCDFESNGSKGNMNTGAIIIRKEAASEKVGSIISIYNSWFENNFGKASLSSEAGCESSFNLHNCSFLSFAPNHTEIDVNSSRTSMYDVNCLTPGAVVKIQGYKSSLIGCLIANLQDQSIMKTHLNSFNGAEEGFSTDLVISNGRSLKLKWGNGSGVHEIGTNMQDGTLEIKPANNNPAVFSGNIMSKGGTWNTSHLVLGTYHIWVDNTGNLRMKKGAPSNDADGKKLNL